MLQLAPAAARDVGAGGVHQHIDMAEAREHLGGHLLDRVRITDVAGKSRDIRGALRAGGGFFQRIPAAADQREAPALAGKQLGDGAADAAASAREDHS
jgi:hypothetical protein